MLFGLQDKQNLLRLGKPFPFGGADALEFSIMLTAKKNGETVEYADLSGLYVHGIARDRVLYLAYAPEGYDQAAPVWQRRVKISLMTIPWSLVETAHEEGKAIHAVVGSMLGTRSHVLWTLEE